MKKTAHSFYMKSHLVVERVVVGGAVLGVMDGVYLNEKIVVNKCTFH